MKNIEVVGGGTINWITSHLALSAPAYGTVAQDIWKKLLEKNPKMRINLRLTKMANSESHIETYDDLKNLAQNIINDLATKIVFWSPAVVDFEATDVEGILNLGDKYGNRLSSEEIHDIQLYPTEKIADLFRKSRKDIFLVTFKQTCGLTEEEQYNAGLRMLKNTSSNLVLANDTKTRINMIITPEETVYCVTEDRNKVLDELIDIALQRSHLTFTRSTVVSGEPVPWESDLVPEVLREAVDYCIGQGAYRRVNGVTAGHFAVKVDDTTFLTSRRKTDFNDMKNVGLVMVKTDGPDTVIAYGSKPSVGGQSQRLVFKKIQDADCILHFHCPKFEDSEVPTVSQREYECGSHQCGENTANGLKQFGNLYAVYLDNHGPNIVFNSKEVGILEIIDFINDNFDLSQKTGGYNVEKYEKKLTEV